MAASLQSTNIPLLFSLKDNNLKKQKFMNNRFPKLKGLVYRRIQFLSFKDKLTWFFTAVEEAKHVSKREAISITKDLYTYLYNTRDIWASFDKFSSTIKKKMIELTHQEPTDFKPYMLRFGYICPYPSTRKNEICGKQVDGTLCKTHSKCQYRLHCLVIHSLPSLHTDLSNIVFHYSLPYSGDRINP